ncbi:MAG: 3-carboxy-cis,cis-muconate cycloisomerase [Geminicoccaceae bacterium]|nr:3-carboxy-cis,cis-muconate cycloisomerase [Geminicoccaceae bacterium]MCB9944889.1 3-carboxy-cis,cis-muconate cycloisomerase [Geminicoccaceae bacterium]
MAESGLLQALLRENIVSHILGDDAILRAMVETEAALASVQGQLGLIPRSAAHRVARALSGFAADPSTIADGMRRDGVPVPALVRALRRHVGGDAAVWVHFGATSQDILDTALMLCFRDALAHVDLRLHKLIGSLRKLAWTHRDTPMVARTRYQQAQPTLFGLKAANWMVAHVHHRERLAELRPRLLNVQLSGAAGTLSAMGRDGLAVAAALARQLDLGFEPAPWHTRRDAVLELASWFALVTGSLGKLGQDLLLMAQNEVGEIREADGGGSSAMPHKSNPVRSETLVTLARVNAGSLGTMHQSAIQEHERGGAGWQLEWQELPRMAMHAAAAIEHGIVLTGSMTVDTVRMRANLDATRGILAGEAATLALSAHMDRNEAETIVKAAIRRTRTDGGMFFEHLERLTEAPVDWKAQADPARQLESARTILDAVLADG